MNENPIFLKYYSPQILLAKEAVLDILTELIGLQLVAKYLIKFDISLMFFIIFPNSIHFCYKYVHHL